MKVIYIESAFHRYHPYVSFFYYICVGILGLFLNHPLFLFVACLLLIAVNYSHGSKDVLKRLPMLIVSAFVIVLLNMFLVSKGEHVLFSIYGRSITTEATMFGIVMALSIILILLLFISFNNILNGNKFLFIFSRFLSRTAFLVMLAIRFVPLLKKRLEEITDVQRIKGLTISSGTLKQRCQNGMTLIQILLTWSLEEAIETADSMKARGYGIGNRSSYIPYKMTYRDRVCLLVLGSLLIICLVGGFFGYGRINIYPAISSLQLTWMEWLLMINAFILLSFPLLVEGREQLRWKSYQ